MSMSGLVVGTDRPTINNHHVVRLATDIIAARWKGADYQTVRRAWRLVLNHSLRVVKDLMRSWSDAECRIIEQRNSSVRQTDAAQEIKSSRNLSGKFARYATWDRSGRV